MPIVYAKIPQSIYCSRLTYLPSCLGFFYTGDPDVIRHAAQPTNNRHACNNQAAATTTNSD